MLKDLKSALLALIDDIEKDIGSLNRASIHVTLDQRYQDALERCQPWLSYSGGSAVPEDFDEVEVVKYEPVFTRQTEMVVLTNQPARVQLKMVGEGSYAHIVVAASAKRRPMRTRRPGMLCCGRVG